MGDPFSLLATGIGFTVTTSRFIAQLNAVRDETGIVIKQAKTITEDIAEAEELYLEQKPSLSDRNQFRIEEVIKDTKWAVNKIAKQVEPARRGLAKSGTINVVDRFDWIFRKSSATKSHQDHLAACHGSLLGQISKLRMAKTTARSSDPPPYEEISRDSQVTHDIVRTSPSGKAEKEESNRHRDNKRHLDRSDLNASPEPSSDSFSEKSPVIESDDGELTSLSTTVVHPERARYEAMQQNGMKMRKKPKAAQHPERFLYEETQLRPRKNRRS